MNRAQAKIQDLVASTHPSLAGHFPGNPVVPGTLILDRVCRAATEMFAGATTQEVRKVKFIKPLLPDTSFCIEFRPLSLGVEFRCTQADQLIASGSLMLEPEGAGQ